ncbi:ABC transporter ATP-binding protein [Candidatus Desantisbacteria bacterium CG_4_10_14_0_8_um_filter_39_17]|uniref:ABC transporter ATP-binding protein n=1 Tax=Candidatus Desantisbacteria bacterium CG_4_10_14_0_8_um_filter_39_17 TaxID=1974542 RepID=A0A2H9PBS3_9BACT|nr:MAG: ABC transporter ATP-binding protein [Candidatus Desantisbacteria bacterium CG_4_10_14_0_8_um_filter_39_17]
MIKISNLNKKFGEHNVLCGLSLDINPGELIGIIGPSGCGKSVLLKHIIGLLKPDSGEIFIDGMDITKLKGKDLKKIRFSFGMVFQGGALFDSLTVEENVGFGLKQHTDLNDEEIRKIVSENLQLVGLIGTEDVRIEELSGGMKKRVALARAIVMNPRIILYDEPTTGVDVAMIDNVNSLIRDLQERLKVTSIAVTHDLQNAYKIADRIAVFHQGKIACVENVEEMKKREGEILEKYMRTPADCQIK